MTDTEFARLSAPGALLLTPGEFAAGAVRAAFDRHQRALGATLWTPAPVLSVQAWLRSLWNDRLVRGEADQVPLNAAQEALLWREIVADDPAPDTVAAESRLAQMAAAAFARAAAFLALDALPQHAGGSADAAQLVRWFTAFERRCHEQAVIAPALLPEQLARVAADLTQPAGSTLWLMPDPDRSPAANDALAALEAAGLRFAEWTTEAPHAAGTPEIAAGTPEIAAGTPEIFACHDTRAEGEFMAAWLERSFATTSATPARQLRIAIVLAEPAALDEQLPVLRSALARELDDVTADERGAPWTGVPVPSLSAEPPVFAALALLDALAGPVDVASWTALLTSPYILESIALAAAAEFCGYVLAEHRTLQPALDAATVLRLATGERYQHADGRAGGCAAVAACLRSLEHARSRLTPRSTFTTRAMQRSTDTTRSYADWAGEFRAVLAAVGFPRLGVTSTAEAEALEAWEHALDLIATLDAVAAPATLHEALNALKTLAAAPRATAHDHDAPLQFVSAEQAVHARFDALLIAGATDVVWRPREAADPLLPWSLQAAHGMPGTDAVRSAEQATGLTNTLLHSASRVAVSYALHTAEGEQAVASALAADLPIQAAEEPPTHVPEVQTEILGDTMPLPSLPFDSRVGGAAVLRSQAACSFRAFAELRLRSTAPGEREAGLGQGEAGTLLHTALDAFWRDVESHPRLLALTADELTTRTERAMDEAFQQYGSPATAWERSYLAAQRVHLRRMLLRWLRFEQARAPFVVVERETNHELRLGGLQFRVRRDRVDRLLTPGPDGLPLPDAPLVLIDYKTGSADPKSWDQEPPAEPQVPLYAQVGGVAGEPFTIAAVAFGRLKPAPNRDSMGFAGLTYEDDPGILGPSARVAPTDLEARVATWHTAIESLASDVATSSARLTPREGADTCKGCDQRMLCRVDAVLMLANGDDADDAASREDDGE